jgi:hypothetical protein
VENDATKHMKAGRRRNNQANQAKKKKNCTQENGHLVSTLYQLVHLLASVNCVRAEKWSN